MKHYPSILLFIFTPIHIHTYLLNVEPRNLLFLKTYNTDFEDIIIVFTNQNGRLLEREDKFSFNSS